MSTRAYLRRLDLDPGPVDELPFVLGVDGRGGVGGTLLAVVVILHSHHSRRIQVVYSCIDNNTHSVQEIFAAKLNYLIYVPTFK